ncbi:MAG: P-loop NTPase fold protein [Bacteroidales bacterium]|nr:P-loop NTPase fold protein [Bacteroidales bacterium]
MKKIITKLNDYFYQTAFAVLLFISFFIFKDFWVECLNKFWVGPIAEKINNNNIYIIPFAVIIAYYIKQLIVTKTYNTKRLMFYIAFVGINVLCYISGYWQYTSKWTTLLIILPLICEIILDVKIYCKRKFSKQITPELEIEKIKDCKDEYNRKTIYETTYNTLKTCFYEEGSFAVSISGAWGSGKTVFKEQLKKNYEKDNKVSIIEFEAWKCDSPTIIIRNFFTQLKDKLKIYFPNISIDFNNYIDLLLDNDSVKPLRVIAKGVNNLLNKDKDPFDTIKNYLKESKHKVVVFIDDVDRLDADEIKEVLRLVRNTANFPYIQFIVTCDNDYVCDTLKKKGIENPKLYLEKFFNLEISLPKFEERIICEELKSRISKTISDIWGIKENDIQIDKMIYYRYDEFTNNIKDCVLVNKVLLSMRDVIGFHNSFKLIAETYKNYENQTEIDFQDLFFLELLRYKYPKLHSALWDNTFDFLYLSQNYKQYILNDYFLRKREMIQQSRRNKKNNVPTIDIDSYKEKDEEFKQKIKNYINDNDDVEIPINIFIYLFVRNKYINNPIYKVDCFDRYFMYRLNEKVLTISDLSTIIDKDNITIEKVDEIFEMKYNSQFEDRTKEILGQIFKNKDLEYKKAYNFIKLILQNSNKPQLKAEISIAVMNYFKDIPLYRDNEHLKDTLDLYNYCDLKSSDNYNAIFYKFLTTLLLKPNLETRLFYKYNEDTKNIIEDFLVNTSQKIPVTQCLNQLNWENEDAFKNNCILSVEELKDIQLNYFKKSEDKFSDESIMLFQNCWEKVNEHTTTLTDKALTIMKKAIEENPNGYFEKFVIYGNSTNYIHHTEIAPALFYEQIFENNEEFEQFLNNCNSNSIEEKRVKNFWRLFKNNGYKNLHYPSDYAKELIDKNFEEIVKYEVKVL